MNRRTLLWLAGGLAILVLLAVVGQRRSSPTAPADAETALLLPGLMESLDEVEGVAIVGAGNEPVATLERGTEGWTVRERGGYPADLTKVRHTLLTLAEAKILEAKTANRELHARLGVEDPSSADATGLAVTLQGLDPPVTVIVGDAAGEYRRYVRRAAEDQSYLINVDPEVGETAADWLDTGLVDIASSRIREVAVTHPDGEVVRITKSSAEQPNFTVENIPEGRTLLYDSVANTMAGVLQDLSLEDVAAATDEAEGETITEFRTFDGLVLTIEGSERDDGGWISVTANAEPGGTASTESAETDEQPDPAAEAREINEALDGWRFRIPSYKFDQLTRRMDDLLKAQT